MGWEASSVFLVIFLVSLGLTLVSLAMGVLHVSLPHIGDAAGDAHFGHGPGHAHVDLGHAHADVGHGELGHGPWGQAHPSGSGHGHGAGVSPFNLATLLAFLTWFGGAGFILTSSFGVVTVVAVASAALVGLVGAAGVFLFLARVLVPGQTPYLRPEDYDLDGTVGSLSVGIRPGGTGEMVYTQAGKRFVATAKSDDGTPIDRGAEVVVVRHEDGVTYVQTLERLLNEEEPKLP